MAGDLVLDADDHVLHELRNRPRCVTSRAGCIRPMRSRVAGPMDPYAFLPLLEVSGMVVAARIVWWMLGDFVLDHVDLPGL